MKVVGDPKHVLRTVLGSIANISNKARTVLTIAVRNLASLVMPLIAARYDKIYRDEEQRTANIKTMYPEVFSVARKIFPEDAQLALFMVNPVAMTAWSAARGAGDIALDLVDALSGQSPTVVARTRHLRRRTAGGAYKEAINAVEQVRILLEAPAMASRDKNEVVRLLRAPDFQRAVMGPDTPALDIQQRAREAKNQTLNDVIDVARAISQAETPDELAQLGIDISDLIKGVGQRDPAARDQGLKAGLRRADAEAQTEATEPDGPDGPTGTTGTASAGPGKSYGEPSNPSGEQTNIEETQLIKDQIFKLAKGEAIDMIITRLQTQIEEFKALGSPAGSDLARAYNNTINRIQALAR